MRGLKIQFQLWHFFGILMVTAYSCSLASRLTNSSYEKRIDSARDFMKTNLTWGREGAEPIFELLFDESDRYGKRFRERYVAETSEADRHEKILRGNYAILGGTIESRFFPEDPVRPEDLKYYRVMKKELSKYYTTFGVQPWLWDSANMVMLRLKEVGLVYYHVHDVLRRRTGMALREITIEHDVYTKTARVLRLTPLAAGFLMLLVGLAISTIVFYKELSTFGKKSSVVEVLRNIEKNRRHRRFMEMKKKTWRIDDESLRLSRLERKRMFRRIP